MSSSTHGPVAPRLLTVKQFSEWAGWSVRTTERRIATGQIKAIKSGRLVRIPASEIERLLSAQR